MEKSQVIESILENAKVQVTQFVEKQPTITCPIEYELELLEIAKEFARSLIVETQGKIPKSRNQKKSPDGIWKVRDNEGPYIK